MLINMEKLSLVYIWLTYFLFTASVAIFVQLWFLPAFLPGGTSEHGLLLATDSVGYHQLALEIAENINKFGWSEWIFAPKGWSIVGLTAAVYALAGSEPWVMIPLNALAHATCGLAIIMIALCFTDSRKTAIVASLPYVLFPSASFWYTQLLKDGIFNVGFLLFLMGWVYLVRECLNPTGWKKIARSLIAIFFGFMIFGAMRPYAMTLANAATIIVLLISCGFLLSNHYRYSAPLSKLLPMIGMILLVYSVQLAYPKIIVNTEISAMHQISMNQRADYSPEFEQGEKDNAIERFIRHKLKIIAGTRRAFIVGRPDAASTIDREVLFKTPTDIVSYIPRATQIVFTAPFPNMWFEAGSTGSTTIMRRISMIEMLAVYGILAGVPIAIWAWRKRIELWVTMSACGSILVVYGLSSPNIGTLYRTRYAYLMVFLALGVLGWSRLRRRE